MRICFIADSSSIHVHRIVAFFVQEGHEILVISTAIHKADLSHVIMVYGLPTVASASRGNEGHLYPARKSALRRYIAAKCKREHKELVRRFIRIARLFLYRRHCFARIEEFAPQVICIIRAFPEGLYARWGKFEHFVLRTAGSDISYYPRIPILGHFIRKVIRQADYIITQSEYERAYLRQELDVHSRIEITNIGTDVTLFRPTDRCNRARYGLQLDSIVVVSNRYLEGFYNGLSVIEAFIHAKKQFCKLELLYISPSPITEIIRKKITSMSADIDGLHIVEGPIPPEEMAEALNCGDIWVSLSSVDGVPNSMLEAMSCGLVPIVSDIPQLHEWVRHGDNGFVVPLQDIVAMADRIVELASNKTLLTTFSFRCRERIHQQGSYEDNMRRMVKFVAEAACSQNKS